MSFFDNWVMDLEVMMSLSLRSFCWSAGSPHVTLVRPASSLRESLYMALTSASSSALYDSNVRNRCSRRDKAAVDDSAMATSAILLMEI